MSSSVLYLWVGYIYISARLSRAGLASLSSQSVNTDFSAGLSPQGVCQSQLRVSYRARSTLALMKGCLRDVAPTKCRHFLSIRSLEQARAVWMNNLERDSSSVFILGIRLPGNYVRVGLVGKESRLSNMRCGAPIL